MSTPLVLRKEGRVVTITMYDDDYMRLMTAVKRYSEVLTCARAYYLKKMGKDPTTVSNRSSPTTIFHLLDIPPNTRTDTNINLCKLPPITPPTVKKPLPTKRAVFPSVKKNM